MSCMISVCLTLRQTFFQEEDGTSTRNIYTKKELRVE